MKIKSVLTTLTALVAMSAIAVGCRSKTRAADEAAYTAPAPVEAPAPAYTTPDLGANSSGLAL